MRAFPVVLAALLAPAGHAYAGDPPAAAPQPKEIVIVEGLAIGPCGTWARTAIHTDAVEEQVVRGTWGPPKAGDKVTLPDGSTRTWAPAHTKDEGTFGDDVVSGGYLFARVTVPAERVMLLAASGHGMVYANGEPRAGDPYSYGFVRLPVLLHAGDNDFLFAVSRGPLKARLVEPEAPVFISTDDATLPDLWPERPNLEIHENLGAVVVVNAAAAAAEGLEILSSLGTERARATQVPRIPAWSTRKVQVALPDGDGVSGDKATIALSLLAPGRRVLHSTTLGAHVVHDGHALRVETFRSHVDESVQKYAILPATGSQRGLLLSLHGAGVEARNQAASYAPKSWLTVVAPTNRRPYGFDWEDWGRLDALEVLHEAPLGTEEQRQHVYLSGHSMGGHGTWQMGVTFPGLWAAIGPSAGWRSFSTYAGEVAASQDRVAAMLARASSPSDTEALATNLAGVPVYALHGDADDNVPVAEMRAMLERLKPFCKDLQGLEQKGAGHWWDLPETAGVDCVDWAPMMEMFSRRTLPPPESVVDVDFATMSPGVSATRAWATIECQQHALQPSRVRLHLEPNRRVLSGTTENVLRMTVDLRSFFSPGIPTTVVALDGGRIEAREPYLLRLERGADGWAVQPMGAGGVVRTATRYGPFKDAFRNGMTFVYGTKGTPEENAWAFAKARYDAETWYVRGNGAVQVLPDTAWKAYGVNAILYGDADANSAWSVMLADSAVQVHRGSVKIGGHEIRGDDIACLFVRPSPRPESGEALVAVVAGTGPAGRRLCERVPYFTSGVGLPDVTVMRADVLSKGEKGLVAAGFFGPDWSVENGDFAWREETPKGSK